MHTPPPPYDPTAWTRRPPVLEAGDGLVLTLRDADDAEALFAALDGSRAFVGRWLPWVDAFTDVGVARRKAAEARAQYAAGTSAVFTLRQHGRVIGSVGLHDMDDRHRGGELGYWLTRDAAGRGHATEAAAAVLDWAFREAHRHRVVAKVSAENTPSRRVVERLGFRQEGLHREAFWIREHFGDVAVFALLRGDWAARR